MQDPTYPATPGAATFGPSAGPYISWSAVVAGALVAAGISFVLMTFGAGIGLSIASPAPTWRNASAALALLSGLWVLIVAVGSYAAAGYIAGRLRTRLTPAGPEEVEFRDGLHGAITWGLATLIAGLFIMAEARLLAPAYAERESSTPSAGQTGPAEPRFVSYEVDRLLRADRRPDAPEATSVRAEAGRLLMASLDQRNFGPEDRSYLVRLVAARTGLAAPDAERRVDAILTQTKEKANRARRSAVILAFMTAASLVLGLLAAWMAAGVGGRHRDGDTVPSLDWRPRSTVVR